MGIEDKNVTIFHNKGKKDGITLPHLHSQLEIYYNISGCISFFNDGKFYKCNGYDLIVIPPTAVHKAIYDKLETYDRCVISIESDVVEAIYSLPFMNKDDLDFFLNPLADYVNMTSLNEKEHAEFMDMVQKSDDTNSGFEKAIILLQLINFTREKFRRAVETVDSYEPTELADKVIFYIENNLDDNLSVEQVAKNLYMSESSLSKLFKKKTNMTIKQYITARKIAVAKKYLYMGCSGKEAASKAYFKNYASFSRTFKRETGRNPHELRELNQPL